MTKVDADVISRAAAIKVAEALLTKNTHPEHVLYCGNPDDHCADSEVHKIIDSIAALPAVQPAGGEAMRRACIDKVKELRDDWHAKYEHYAASGAPTGLFQERIGAIDDFTDEIIERFAALEAIEKS